VRNSLPAQLMGLRSRFQWIWNLRLELGQQLLAEPVRTTEFAPAHQEQAPGSASGSASASPAGYAPAAAASSWKAGHFSGKDFARQPDGTLRCPAGASLVLQERRPEANALSLTHLKTQGKTPSSGHFAKR
jgi:hypothetical protein